MRLRKESYVGACIDVVEDIKVHFDEELGVLVVLDSIPDGCEFSFDVGQVTLTLEKSLDDKLAERNLIVRSRKMRRASQLGRQFKALVIQFF